MARTTGMSVRNLRFYCDYGILEFRRTPGGHRLFTPDATERVTLIRRLRTFGLSLARIQKVLDGSVSIAEAAAAQRSEVDIELSTLAWQRAGLSAIENAKPATIAAKLEMLAAVQHGRAAHDMLVNFWRTVLTAMQPAAFDEFIATNIPQPPQYPTASQALAYTELTTLTQDPGLKTTVSHQIWLSKDSKVGLNPALLPAIADAYSRTIPLVLEAENPRPGAELDQFVAAHAAARGERDTTELRLALHNCSIEIDPRMRRYSQLTWEINGSRGTVGAAHYWLIQALHRSLADHGVDGSS
ncbi:MULTISPECIES: MerR family transcriptional regulator [unclassified Nocardia]|uniref:MerR family transcriptional regulator n=1 Tax=unclassified Nocardia TaxID=2637762 RepID=UPI002104103A|nr:MULTISPECIES: MerR family transcriptional regulator [unclassified Nocardia]